MIANIGSVARARSKGAGKAVVGHPRYPWLTRAGIRTDTSWLQSEERLRLEFSEPGSAKRGVVDFALPKDLSAALVAYDVVRRAAHHRLARLPVEAAEERDRLQRLVSPAVPPDSVGRFRWIDIAPLEPAADRQSAVGRAR